MTDTGAPPSLSVVIPLYNGYGADLVSKRVRNYQYNPRYGALLSQLWVR